ncbi:MAG: L-histidine N(alpha)-methyltransferase, partial [Pseudomonadota bacterium]
LNLLRLINRELDGAFALENFGHEARFNPEQGRIEMHLRCLRDHEVQVAGQAFAFARGESIHTENAYKYSPEAFRQLANLAGWAAVDCWFDPDGLVSLHLLRA